MFERFTDRTRQVVVLAQDEARKLRHNYIGTEHLLLGLLRVEDSLAARALESLDISLEEVRAQVARIVGPGDDVTTGHIPFTPRGKKVLELSLREALSLGHDHIEPEHVLLGIIREREGVAARILLDFGADAETVRQAVIGLLGGPSAPPPTGLAMRRKRKRPDFWEYSVLQAEEISQDHLNDMGAHGWELVGIAGQPGGFHLVFKRRA